MTTNMEQKAVIDAVDHALGYITFDDFMKVDIRAGKILTAERIPKADKLLKLGVDLGPLGQRTICAGIAESYDVNALPGRNILVVVNLAPRKMRGIESNGMLLAAARPDGVVELAMCPMVEPGTRIG